MKVRDDGLAAAGKTGVAGDAMKRVAEAQPWRARIGERIPPFEAMTTRGPISFADWAAGHWVLLFSHPAAMTPICTTEIAAFAEHGEALRERGVRMFGISPSSCETIETWLDDIKRLFGEPADFPMAEDPDGTLLRLFDMVSEEHEQACAMRKTIVVGPDLRIRMISEYPFAVGRSVAELVRTIDALQTADTFNVGTGADWQPGEDCVVLGASFPGHMQTEGSPYKAITSYLVTVTDPRKLFPKLWQTLSGRRQPN